MKCCLLLFYTKTTDHFSFGMWPTVKSGVYTTGNDQLSVWTTKLLSTSESQTCTKKRSWSLFSDLLPIWSTIVFWIPVKPLYLISYVQQIDEMHRKLQCMQPAGQHKGPNSSPWHLTARGTTNASKVEQTGLQSFDSSTIFIWPLTNRLPFLQAFWQLSAGKMLPLSAGGRKCFSRVHWILKHGFLHYTNKFISCLQ